MSKLLEYGMSPAIVAHAAIWASDIEKVDKLDYSSIRKGTDAARALIHEVLSSSAGRHFPKIHDLHTLCTEVFGLDWQVCSLSGDTWPRPLMVELPTGKLMYVGHMYEGPGEWEYDDRGNIVRSNRLYGDRNILQHNANPLQYLKFKCLPDERLASNTDIDNASEDEWSGHAPCFLGIELEVEKKKGTPNKIEHLVANDLGMDYMVLKHDGSLQDGFEIVTAPSTIGYHLKMWDKFFDNSAKFLQSYASGRCGMHVHVNRKTFTPMHLGKFSTFINSVDNREFITTIAGRNSTYSKLDENKKFQIKSKLISTISNLTDEINGAKNIEEVAKLRKQIADTKAKIAKSASPSSLLSMLQETTSGGEKYSAVRLDKPGTIEVRIFRGNVSKIGFFKNLEFVHALVAFTREATFKTKPLTPKEIEERKLKRKENTDYTLHYTYFLDWLAKDETGYYNNLKLWLNTHKITDKFTRKKASSKVPPEKRITDEDIRACA